MTSQAINQHNQHPGYLLDWIGHGNNPVHKSQHEQNFIQHLWPPRVCPLDQIGQAINLLLNNQYTQNLIQRLSPPRG